MDTVRISFDRCKAGVKNRYTFEEFNPCTKLLDGFSFVQKYSEGMARPPLTPEGFGRELQERRRRAQAKDVPLFTCDRDSDIVTKVYRQSFERFQQQARWLEYSVAGWGVSEVRPLCEVLPTTRVQALLLGFNPLGDKGLCVLSEALCPGSRLELRNRRAGRPSPHGLSHAVFISEPVVCRSQSFLQERRGMCGAPHRVAACG